MASYKNFEDLPVWKTAIALAYAIFTLTAHESFYYKGDLVNQLRRAALSISNNIAEGFERGTTNELINFLYYSRGSCAEVRSMLRFSLLFDKIKQSCEKEIQSLITESDSTSRQIHAWLDSLQNTNIKGNRYLNKKIKHQNQQKKEYDKFDEEMSAFRKKMHEGLETGTWGEASTKTEKEKPLELKNKGETAKKPSNFPSPMSTHSEKAAQVICPLCGKSMKERFSKDGIRFLGCSDFPHCKGSRSL
jgi:four helix bundle protein